MSFPHQRTGAASFFDLVVISGDHPWEKPAPGIYDHIRQKMALDSLAQAVMIGDNWDMDMQGGINAGVKSLIWIRRADTDTTEADELKLTRYADICHRTTDVLLVPSFLDKIFS